MPALLNLAAALGTRNGALIEQRLWEAIEEGHEEASGELVLMAVFVTGFPAGLSAARSWAKARKGSPPPEPMVRPEYRERGEEGFVGVYGSQANVLRQALGEAHPALPDLVTEVGYGWMMARPGMAPDERECCMVSMLIPTGLLSPLYSHLRGALRLGAPRSRVVQAVEAGLAAMASPVEPAPQYAEDVWRTWNRVLSRSDRTPEET